MNDTVEHEYLTVRELADLLRIKERKVYDLAASGTVPCSRATGKLLFPARDVHAWIARQSSGGGALAAAPRPPIVLGSHDPLLDWAIRESGCGLATYVDGSLDGLTRFAAGEGVAAGLHIHDPDSGDWNVPAVARTCAETNAVLIGFARRQRGLVQRRDGPGLSSLADLKGHRVTMRQSGSGTDSLLRQLLAQAGLAPDAIEISGTARTESDAVQSVARGEADVTLGLESVARDFGLDFTPVITERFDLLVDRRAWFEPQLQTLIRFCEGPELRQRAQAIGGYDLQTAGEVRWNA